MNNNSLFGYSILGKGGLGNMLFPWARCYLWCQDHNVPMIAPIWTQIRIGPYIRREKDKRNYQKLFHHDGYIAGIRRLILLSTLQQVVESKQNIHLYDNNSKKIVVFEGLGDFFLPLLSRHEEVHSELKRITKTRHLNSNLPYTPYIGIHVRRGDFSIPSSTTDLLQKKQNYQIPLEWYIQALKSIRQALSTTALALVFSDGSISELKELLNQPNVKLFQGGTAITDLLALSEARVIIASGSSFSMWGSFLGQVPTIWYPGQRRQHILGSGNNPKLEPEWKQGENFSEEFLITALHHWQQKATQNLC